MNRGSDIGAGPTPSSSPISKISRSGSWAFDEATQIAKLAKMVFFMLAMLVGDFASSLTGICNKKDKRQEAVRRAATDILPMLLPELGRR